MNKSNAGKKHTQTIGEVLHKLQEKPTDRKIQPAPQYGELVKEQIQSFDWCFNPFEHESISHDTDQYISLSTMLRYVKSMAWRMAMCETPYWLTLIGRSGLGKTALAKKLVLFVNEHLNLQVKGSRLLHWPDLYDKMKSGDWALASHFATEFDFIVIDELSPQGSTDFNSQQLSLLADRRMNKNTIWTSNLTLNEISERIDERVRSRMIRGRNTVLVLHPDIPDYNDRSNRDYS